MKLSKRRILYVEDHDDTRDLVTLVLAQRNFEVITANTLSGAVRMAGTEQFDLYLLDTRLPDGSGVELCQRLRELDKQTPILFYSAAAYDADRKKAFECGAQGYVTKPSDNGELGDIIEKLIAQSSFSRSVAS
jgi:DNA-binding response OmpR family regulator